MTSHVHEAAVARQDAGSWAEDAARWAVQGQHLRSAAATGETWDMGLDRAGVLLEQAAADLATAANRARQAASLLDARQPRTGPPPR